MGSGWAVWIDQARRHTNRMLVPRMGAFLPPPGSAAAGFFVSLPARSREHPLPHLGHAVVITDGGPRGLFPDGLVDLPHGCIVRAVTLGGAVSGILLLPKARHAAHERKNLTAQLIVLDFGKGSKQIDSAASA